MALRIRFLSDDDPRVYRFDDEMDEVVIGRNGERCHVVVAPELTQVGREHCALRRRLGRYRLILNGTDVVLLDGEPAIDGEELPPKAEIQLGPAGPTLAVETLWPKGLPETQSFERPVDSPAKLLRRLRGRQRTIRRWQTLIALLLVVGVTAGIWAFVHTTREVKRRHEALLLTLEGELAQLEGANVGHAEAADDLRRRMAEVRGVIDVMRPDIRGLREAVAGIGPRMEGLERRVAEATPMIQHHLRRAEASTYLVLIDTGRDVLAPQATAWVVGPGLLATNAHVARAFEQLGEGQDLVVRSSGAEPESFVVRGVRIHPGFEAYSQLWQQYTPTRVGLGGGLERLNGVPACDVALLEVAADVELGPPLELAEQSVLEALGPGDVVGFLGFPLEDMAGGAVNLKSPSPSSKVGHVTGVTNFFLGRTTPDNAFLVQHSMTAVGGTSGSPILDKNGKVVAVHNAGNFVFVGNKRIPGADVNFAQRVDVLKELLDGRADEVQAARTRRWELGIAEFRSLEQAAKKVALDFLGEHLERIEETTGTKPVKLHEEVALLVPDPSKPPTWTRTLALPDPGVYVVFAWSTTGEDIDLLLLHPDEDRVLREDREKDSFPILTIGTDHPVEVRAVIAAGASSVHGEFTLQLYRFERKPKEE